MKTDMNQFKQLKEIDQSILDLINQRFALLGEGLPSDLIEKSALIKLSLEKGVYPHLDESFVEELSALLNKGILYNENYRVAFLGPLGTFSHQATTEAFGDQGTLCPQETIPDVFEAVFDGNADYGMVPVENSVEGAINLTLDLLREGELFIIGEITIPVCLNLIGLSSKVSEIKEVFSHPQPLAQCRNWLRNHIPSATLIAAPSTTKAVEMIEGNKLRAAVGSKMAASSGKYKILEGGIQDYKFNKTRFLILSRNKNKVVNKAKTSLVVLCPDRPGALVDVLKIFKEHNINLSKIESRPSKRKDWEYAFFIDFLGHENEPHVVSAIEKLKVSVLHIKVLGSYPNLSPNC